MDRNAYLERIGHRGRVAPAVETLRRLHIEHLTSVPFENLDIHLRERIVLDEPSFYGKIVERRRGGYCYELNGLFAWLLRDIGFDVSLISASVYETAADRYGPEGDHLCLLVTLDERWLVDVGFGASFLEPMCLDDPGERVEEDTAYRLVVEGEEWTMWSRADGQPWTPGYRFTLRPRRLYDFTYANHYMQTSPDSIFTQKRVCTRATPEGRLTLSDMRFIETAAEGRTDRPVESLDEYASLLLRHFGVSIDVARLG